ncbi:MAG: hypothetical protein QOE24_2081 [Frankiales bacterium]|jgi:hypothetical protein|nr:hypothetical protein [Frankiales bacterium]MDX6209690.1 hypothetical protein [Frankiales bacterium]
MAITKSTEQLTQELAQTFDGFDARMQQLTSNLDPDSVRTAGAMTLEIGMYANNLAKILNDLIGIVQAQASDPAGEQDPVLPGRHRDRDAGQDRVEEPEVDDH